MMLFSRTMQKYDDWSRHFSFSYPGESLELQVLKHKKQIKQQQQQQTITINQLMYKERKSSLT
jgi:hypothetical protein